MIAIAIIIIAYSPIISYSVELRNGYMENRENLKNGDAGALQELLINMTKDFVPESKEEFAKDTIFDILQEILLKRARFKK